MSTSKHLFVLGLLSFVFVVLQIKLLLYHSTDPEGNTNDIDVEGFTGIFNRENATERLERIRKEGLYYLRLDNVKAFRHNNHTCLSPEDSDESGQPLPWQRRSPFMVMLGAMKSGTQALSFYLRQHPNIVNMREPESHFFDAGFNAFATSNGILQTDARKLYANYFRAQSITEATDIMTNESLVALDTTPMYLMWSDVVPARLLCVAPWVKLIVILRNPIDRAFSHFDMAMRRSKKPETFETMIERDMQKLYSRGVINKEWKDLDTERVDRRFTGSQTERKAWMNYSGQSSARFSDTVGTFIGRGLYGIQLQHWWEAMDKINKPRSDMLVLRSEEMRESPNEVVNRIVSFLNLPSFQLKSNEIRHAGDYKMGGMKNETRQLLQDFFRPYNEQLYKMLGPEWKGVWEQ